MNKKIQSSDFSNKLVSLFMSVKTVYTCVVEVSFISTSYKDVNYNIYIIYNYYYALVTAGFINGATDGGEKGCFLSELQSHLLDVTRLNS